MKIYESLEEYVPHEGGVSVALGFFDGVHIGHRAVIGAAAGELPCVVLTFRESPAKTLGYPVPPTLSDNARKAELMGGYGADEVIFAAFEAVKDLSPADFVRCVLCDTLGAKKVCCGFNYRFGQGGAGDVETLRTLGAEKGIEVVVAEPVFCDGEQASSSRIRACIASGEIARANRLLGYPYAIAGNIRGGNHIGTTMGFPTVNIPIAPDRATPRYGVYASTISIDGARYAGATNIGVHPTVGENDKPVCETFLLDYSGGDLYGKTAVCELKAFIRPERRFDSVEALTKQVQEDCERIRRTDGIMTPRA